MLLSQNWLTTQRNDNNNRTQTRSHSRSSLLELALYRHEEKDWPSDILPCLRRSLAPRPRPTQSILLPARSWRTRLRGTCCGQARNGGGASTRLVWPPVTWPKLGLLPTTRALLFDTQKIRYPEHAHIYVHTLKFTHIRYTQATTARTTTLSQ